MKSNKKLRKHVKKSTGHTGIVWGERGWQPLFYGFCPNKKSWDKHMKFLGLENEPYPETNGHMIELSEDKKTVCIATVGDVGSRSRAEIIGVIVHEAVHVWQSVQEHIGETSPGREMEACAIQAITQHLIEAFEVTRGFPK